MNELPAGFGEPLHILAPFPWRALGILALAALLALGWALWRRLRRRPMAMPVAPTAPSPPIDPEMGSAIVRIRRQFGERGDYRGGCHALAGFLREWGERTGKHTGRRPFATLTAREIAFAMGEAPLSTLFELVAELQFRRRSPTQDDFFGVCDLASSVVPSGAVPSGAVPSGAVPSGRRRPG